MSQRNATPRRTVIRPRSEFVLAVIRREVPHGKPQDTRPKEVRAARQLKRQIIDRAREES